jgi:hypothetical protein
VTQDGSTLATNAARQKPALCYQLDYIICSPELGSVDFTAAAEDNFFLRAGDATACTKNKHFKLAVCATSAGCRTRHESQPKNGGYLLRVNNGAVTLGL